MHACFRLESIERGGGEEGKTVGDGVCASMYNILFFRDAPERGWQLLELD